MMKKIITITMALILMVLLCGCGNKSYGFGNYQYNKIHVDTYNNSGCFEVKKWYENETGLEVTTKENGNMFLSEGTYILISGDCPFCDK